MSKNGFVVSSDRKRCNEQLLTDLGSVSDLPVSGLQTPDYLHLVVDNDAGNWAA